MDIRIIEDRIRMKYQPKNKREELNAFKEIAQEIALLGLSRTEFFKHAAFQGGTCLRIVYGLSRFSEDLDFILFEPNKQFSWKHFLEEIRLEFNSFGLNLDVRDRSEADLIVKKAFLKENSFGKILQLSYSRDRGDTQTILIKLEIDTNPPRGSIFEPKLVEFPTPFSLTTQDLPSLFAGKIHALLCRKYVKGRDLFDFVWYVTRRTGINYTFLQETLFQQGPWARKKQTVNSSWVRKKLKEKLISIDWQTVKRDVEIFLKPRDLTSLNLWGAPFFEQFIAKLE
jgi:predicted nucleotidyltransferase component of viral defense system